MASENDRLPRKLSAILYADVAGYSRLMGDNEDRTHRLLRDYLDLIATIVSSNSGRVVHYAGDAVLAEFSTATQALECSVNIQNKLKAKNLKIRVNEQIRFRIGVNLGEVIVDRNDIYGDGVNVAARLESLATPGGVCISESVKAAVGNKLSYRYEFMGERHVKNIAQPVRLYRVCLDGNEPSRYNELPSKPSVAVLPFTNMSGDPQQEYFSDGITEDVITQLSKFRGLFVIARNSSFVYKDRAVRAQDVGEELRVAYVVEGSVRRSGNRVRVTAQLVEAATGNQLWADRYDRELEDIFAVQDELTETIAATVGGRVAADGTRRVRARTDANAYDLVLRGQALHFRVVKEANEEARHVLERALELDPDNARAHALLGAVHILDYSFGWSADLKKSLNRALEHGQRSVRLDSTDSQAHAHLGETYLELGKLEQARIHFEKGVALNPADIVSRALYSIYFRYTGNAESAIEQLSEVERLDPFELSWVPWFRGMAYYHLQRYDEAIDSLMRVDEPISDVCLYLAASYGQIGRVDEAHALLQEYLSVSKQEMPAYPGDMFEDWEPQWRSYYTYEPYNDDLCAGLRKAWRVD